MTSYWGIDLGGTKIEGVVLPSADSTEPLCRLRVPTEASEGYAHLLGQIEKLVNQMKAASGMVPERIGIGTPGTLDGRSHLIKNSNTVCLIDQPLKDDLEQKIGAQFRMANDANCFALAEATIGAVTELDYTPQVVFGTIMGTGVGGGLVVNGKVINGLHGIAGEWGHNYLDADSGPCYCGQTGCVETWISGPALERFFHRESGRFLKLPDIVQLHRAGSDPTATATVKRLLSAFGRAMAAIINVIDPEVVVLGGGVGNVSELYTEGVQEITRHLFNAELNTRFLAPRLGDSAGVFGAARLWATA
ncbi:MAG: ROK family protein [Salibacteraceae bacterium]